MTPAQTRANQSERGFSIIEVLIAASVLAIGMVSYVTGTLSHLGLVQEETSRSQALLSATQFMERIRTDDDFAGLYDRLRVNQELSAAKQGTTLTLTNGRGALPPTAYYPDFAEAGSLAVLVDVPFSPDVKTGAFVLREDVNQSEFGLPADLNGDGGTDSDARDGDYEAIPVVVHFVWSVESRATRTLRLFTWLKGTR